MPHCSPLALRPAPPLTGPKPWTLSGGTSPCPSPAHHLAWPSGLPAETKPIPLHPSPRPEPRLNPDHGHWRTNGPPQGCLSCPVPATSSAASVCKNSPFASWPSGNGLIAETHLQSFSSRLGRPMAVWLCIPTPGHRGHPSSAPWPHLRSLSHVACVATPRPLCLPLPDP